jgi:hypothetical protein
MKRDKTIKTAFTIGVALGVGAMEIDHTLKNEDIINRDHVHQNNNNTEMILSSSQGYSTTVSGTLNTFVGDDILRFWYDEQGWCKVL